METNLRNALALSGGDLSILFASPTSIVLWIMAVAIVVWPLWMRWRRARQGALSTTAGN